MGSITAARALSTWAWKAALLGGVAGACTTLGSFARREIRRRGYSSWEDCLCDFKTQPAIFQVMHSHHAQRGETVVSQEWGIVLSRPPVWLRRLLHHGSQVVATLNPLHPYVERVTLTPQEAHQLAALLRGALTEETASPVSTHIIWKREVLRQPRRLFDSCTRRLFPVEVPSERLLRASLSLAAIWDPRSNLPLPFEGSLLTTPTGTRIDCIGWTPAQVSYCTARIQR